MVTNSDLRLKESPPPHRFAESFAHQKRNMYAADGLSRECHK